MAISLNQLAQQIEQKTEVERNRDRLDKLIDES
jgi:hypothetical protein